MNRYRKDGLARLRMLCLEPPATCEETAWVGTRWMIGRRDFTHAPMIENGWPPAYARRRLARATGRADVPDVVVGGRFDALPPASYFKPLWWPDIGGVGLDADTDWDAVSAHLLESHRLLASRRLLR